MYRVAAAALAIIASLAGPAAAEDDLPAGKVGLFGAVRQNLGELSETYGVGWMIGFDAHYQPTRIGQRLALGIAWSTALFTRFGADDASLPETSLNVIEMSLGLRLRHSLSDAVPRFLVATGGGALLRTSVPVPPRDDRLYLGGYAGLAYEQYLGTWLLSLEARYGLLAPDTPRSVTVIFGMGWGSR
ncbi:MAG TPA: hypothetical protein VKZ63_12915 [Kofleriaceae bacterium]|nr:hypothetical protein [Kofleriaceae bacterium]